MAENGNDINDTKRELDEANNSLKELKGQLSDRDKQLKNLGEKAKDNEALTKQITDLQEANKKAVGDYEVKIKQMTIDRDMEKELEGCKYKDLLASKYNTNDLKFKEDGSIENIEIL